MLKISAQRFKITSYGLLILWVAVIVGITQPKILFFVSIKCIWIFCGLFALLLLLPFGRVTLALESAVDTKSRVKSPIQVFISFVVMQVIWLALTLWYFSNILYFTQINPGLTTVNIDIIKLWKDNSYSLCGLWWFVPLVFGVVTCYYCRKLWPYELAHCLFQKPNHHPKLFLFNLIANTCDLAKVFTFLMLSSLLVLTAINGIINYFAASSIHKQPVLFILSILFVAFFYKKNIAAGFGWGLRHGFGLGKIWSVVLSAIIISTVIIFGMLCYTASLPDKPFNLQFQIDRLAMQFGMHERFSMLLIGWFLISAMHLYQKVAALSIGHKVWKICLWYAFIPTICILSLNFEITEELLKHSMRLLVNPTSQIVCSILIILLMATIYKNTNYLSMWSYDAMATSSAKKRSLLPVLKRLYMVLYIFVLAQFLLAWYFSAVLSALVSVYLIPIALLLVLKLTREQILSL